MPIDAFPSLSTLENVASGLLYCGVPAAARRAAAAEALELVGLGTRSAHRPGERSGGECQRAAIARALVNKPTIVLADEPTRSLDTATGRGILGLMDELNRAGTTIVIVTHNRELADALPRVVQLRDGMIDSDGHEA